MSSQTVARPLGVQTPRVKLAPAARRSDGPDAVFLASKYGLTPDPWQADILGAWLGLRADGRWASIKCGLAVPRQNGKNGVVEMRELFGMVVLGEKFLHTAHEVKTARKAFLRLASFFENPRRYPELAAMASEIRKTNGQEAIVLSNGGSCEFVARSKGSGRGFTVDVLVIDEAQELGDEALEALLPTISAAPLGNPQQIFTGTPPGPKAIGENFTRVRDEGHAGKNKRLAWDEWSCLPDADLDDPRNLAATNPALGYRLQYDVAESERGTLSDEGYGRERLGIWASGSAQAKIPARAWSRIGPLQDRPVSEITGRLALAVSVPPDQDRAVIAAVGEWVGGLRHAEFIERRNGTAWVVDRVLELVASHGPVAVAIDPGSPSGLLVPALEAAGIELVKMTARSYAQACGAFYAAVMGITDDPDVTEPTMRHIGQPELDAAVAGAGTRPLGGEAALWAWDRRDPNVDISPLEAVTLAHHGLVTSEDGDPAANVW